MTDTKLMGQVIAVVTSQLGAGEFVTHAAKANAPASLKRAVSAAGAGAAAAVAGFAAMGAIQARGGRLPEDHILGITLPADLVLATTGKNLVVCGRGGLFGRITGVVTIVPLDQISLVEPGTVTLSGVRLTALGLIFTDQSSAVLVFPRPSRSDGETLTAELARLTFRSD